MSVAELPLTVSIRADAEAPRAADIEAVPLVAAARRGDREAFAALVERYQQPAWRLAMSALGNAHDAEDAAQDAFVMAWRRLDELRDNVSFRSWLLTIVWRKAIDRRRGAQTWLRRFVSAEADADDSQWPLDQAADDGPDPETMTMARDAVVRTRAVIRSLPAKLRDALLLAASGEYRYEEIGDILGVPAGTVKWRVSEARRLARQKLERMS